MQNEWDECAYRTEVGKLIDWCRENKLELNTKKTEEMIVDFRQKPSPLDPISIHGQTIKQVSGLKFLGTLISSSLKWDENCSQILSKARQRLYFLRQLKKFKVRQAVMVQFYRAVIESVLTSSVIVWYGNATARPGRSTRRG